jgi:CubicO group peptidase (beta-lactamase class C family)
MPYLRFTIPWMMRNIATAALALMTGATCHAQPTYFPPAVGNTWETTDPASLGWCQPNIDELYTYLEQENTKAFILLKDGRIVLEQYFNGHTASSLWYWASAGKTLTAFMVGIAQQEGHLSIQDATSAHLGTGWTSCTPEQEAAITVRHQLTMTTGLDDGVAALDCTLPSCLSYLAQPGTRWSYHNAPYTLLDQVIESATGVTLNQYTTQKVKTPTGMTGTFQYVESNNVFFSNARSMARFGLLVQNGGNWNGNPIMTDTDYFTEMVNTSQSLNESYGYLWWLSGKSTFMVPGLQTQFPGSLMQHAPDDCVMALGKNGQFINVSTAENMVWIRMGDAPDNSPVPFLLNDSIWERINQLGCTVTGIEGPTSDRHSMVVAPNPFGRGFAVSRVPQGSHFVLLNPLMQAVWSGADPSGHDFSALPSGMYLLRMHATDGDRTVRLIKE